MSKRAPKVPAVVVNLGNAVELRIRLNNDIITYKWPLLRTTKKGAPAMLATDPNGNKLFILPANPADEKSISDLKLNRSIEKAAAKYSQWSEFEPDRAVLISTKEPRLNKIGRAVHVVYKSDKFSGKPVEYIHEFDTPPIVWADSKKTPRIAVITGGAFEITSRGIEG